MRSSSIYNLKLPPKLKQVDGIEYMLKHKKCINASDCGTGKTIQALAVVTHTKLKALVVCPAYLMDNWDAEVEKFTHLTDDDITITSYSKLKVYPSLYKGVQIVIFDEFQYLKNMEAARTVRAHELVCALQPEYVLGLSGTPIKNRVPEFYSLMCLVSYGDFKGIHTEYNYYQFCNTFSIRSEMRISGRRIVKYSGVKNKTLLREYLVGKYVKVRLDEVVTLAEPLESYVTVKYKDDKKLEEVWLEHNKSKGYDATVKRDSALLKVDFTHKYINELIENGNGPIVLFTCHPDVCENLAGKLKHRVGIITGKTDTKFRFKIVEDFQNGKYEVLCCTIGAASTGFNMTKARHLVFNDLDWVPANNYQAKARVQRMGQENRVHYHFINGSKTDAMITRQLVDKEKVIKEVFCE